MTKGELFPVDEAHVLAEWKTKFMELYELAASLQRLRSFALELQRSTKGKRFDVRNALAWDAIYSLRRMLVIDLAGWVDSIQGTFLRRNLQGATLANLRVSKNLAAKIVVAARAKRPARRPEDERWARERAEQMVMKDRRSALQRLFGSKVAERGHATHADVERLCKKIFRWSKHLDAWRNEHAHRYGFKDATVKDLRLHHVAKRFSYCARLMNDLRLLLDSSTYSMPSMDAATGDVESRDLLDLIVLGSADRAFKRIDAMPGPYHFQRRDAYYAKMHRRPRKTKESSFN